MASEGQAVGWAPHTTELPLMPPPRGRPMRLAANNGLLLNEGLELHNVAILYDVFFAFRP